MSAEGLFIILVVGLIAGWLAGHLVRGTGYGLIADLCLGIVGVSGGGKCSIARHPPKELKGR